MTLPCLLVASYISLECGGFLAGLGLDVTIMVRSILLRGFDQQMAEKIGTYMEEHGINFVKPCVPTALELVQEKSESSPRQIKVSGKYNDGTPFEDIFNTVIFAIGRDADTARYANKMTVLKFIKMSCLEIIVYLALMHNLAAAKNGAILTIIGKDI